MSICKKCPMVGNTCVKCEFCSRSFNDPQKHISNLQDSEACEGKKEQWIGINNVESQISILSNGELRRLLYIVKSETRKRNINIEQKHKFVARARQRHKRFPESTKSKNNKKNQGNSNL